MGDKEDYLTSYREFFENFAATVNPEDQLPVNIAGYTITEAELPGEVLYWITQYLQEKQCPLTLMTPLRRIILDEVQVASKKQPNEYGFKSDESVYIALRLMQAVTARVNDVCLRYLDNARLDSLPPPPPPEKRELKTVSIATKNSRRVMEDRHVEIGNLEALFGIETTEPTSFYAVYDGHAGSAAATYCAAHLHQYLVESPHFTTDLRRALKDAFLRTDTDFIRKSNQERACGGSTAVAVAVRGRKLLAAWAGDSLALLAKRMRLMQLVIAHKPHRQDERDRIEQSGGTVMYWGTWRVNGQLAVSRAIGDAQYKPYVTARPETATVDLDGDEDFVVVACDGLWDFVSEDDVALSVYRQIASDPDDLKAVTKRLVVQAKRQGSADNISIIVVFLKDPREIAADNYLPMDLGLDNALANAPPFVMEAEACKRLDGAVAEAEAECGDADADNGVDNSDSDSEDLGPETAVDADDLDNDARLHPQPPTPPAHAVEENHVDGGLVDNVAESGEESEDEWNYFKGEGETDERPRDDTPCQDNSAWETSSVDMNSSPLNPDAPPFVPTGVTDVVLAESPRKPLPMDDIELPDVAQFSTDASKHPAELLDLDNCDQLNGHHNVSIDEAAKEHLNGNEKCSVDSLGFGFGGGEDTGLLHDFDRIQKDTTDFCNIQVFQAHTESNPFAETNEELLERLKNKERDPMSMSFYQEKDHDTAERVDLNAVRALPDSDDDDHDRDHDHRDHDHRDHDHRDHDAGCHTDKENISPQQVDLLGAAVPEPNNDILRFDNDNAANFASDNFMDNFTSNIQSYSNLDFEQETREEVAHTDTPESHKLLFEQIPEIPDGKSSELGFSNEDALEDSENRAITPQEDTSPDVDMEIKLDDSPSEDLQPKLTPEPVDRDELAQAPVDNVVNEMREIITESEMKRNREESVPEPAISPPPSQHEAFTPEHDVQHNIVVDVHHNEQALDEFQDEKFDVEDRLHGDVLETDVAIPEIQFEVESAVSESPVPSKSPLPIHESPAPSPAHAQAEPLHMAPSPSPTPAKTEPLELAPSSSPAPAHTVPLEVAPSPSPAQSPLPSEPVAPSPLPADELKTESPAPAEVPLPRESPAPQEIAPSPVPDASRPETASPVTASPLPVDEPTRVDVPVETDSRAELTPAPEPAEEPHGPAPDLVPEEPQRSALVTDIDIGIPESHAQEICVPVTDEIPAAETAAPPSAPDGHGEDLAPAVSDTPIAADAIQERSDDTAVIAAAAVAVAATAAVAAAAAGTKAKASPATKRSPTTPKAAAPARPAPKTTAAAKTPVSAKKPPAATTPKAPAAAKTAPARTPLSAGKPAPAKTAPVAKAAPAAKPAPSKPGAAAPKPASAKTSSITRTTAAPRPAPAKPAAKEPAAAAKSAVTARAVPAARPAPRPAAPRPATAGAKPATTTAAKPAAGAPRPASARPAPLRKPLTNGDVRPAAKPAPRPPPRAAAAPAPHAPPSAPAAATTKLAAPKPAPRATRPAVKDADKSSKDLANKRITAKTAPPRTAPYKASGLLAKNNAPKPIKKPVAAEPKKEVVSNGVSHDADTPAMNGTGEADALSPVKPPPSPPAADNALLPDVIA